MNTAHDQEVAAHAKTYAELRAARLTIDRMTIHRAVQDAKIARLEQEAEAQRDMIAIITAGGPRAAF